MGGRRRVRQWREGEGRDCHGPGHVREEIDANEREACFRRSTMPTMPRKRGPSGPQFCGSPLLIRTWLDL